MKAAEIIESGQLELYVYGVLTAEETAEISSLAKQENEVNEEIIAIEKSVINLSSSLAPALSAGVFERLKTSLALASTPVIPITRRRNTSTYLGWAASIALLLGVVFQYNQNNTVATQLKSTETEKSNLQKSVVTLTLEKQQTEVALQVIRDRQNTVVALAGQTVAPQATATIYWNQKTQQVYVDASGLPEPPKGKVYQIWSLKLTPTLTPTSIGLLNDFTKNPAKVFAVETTGDAQAFGITLEPAGGSATPTMEQLYTLVKV